MKKFMDESFLLSTPTAEHLFHDYAEMTKIPVIDYHCHIDPREIYEDRQFENITQVWLGGDHYKWRQMRTCGVEEQYITGNASDYEKFEKWAWCMPRLIGNPLYHWSHYELKYYFGYEGNLNPDTCREVWDMVNAKLKTPEFSVRNLIRKSNVKLICTTDDPVDTLEWHKKIQEDETFDVQVLPAWRPDRAMNLEKADYGEYIEKLAKVSGVEIKDFETLKLALINRIDYFASMRSTVSDHGLEFVSYEPATEAEVDMIFKNALKGEKVTALEQMQFKTAFMMFMAKEYHKRNWVMQLHYGCRRNNNTAMFKATGADTGFDCISDYTPVDYLVNFLDALASTDELPKTILYSLNPNDNAIIGTAMGCFQGDGVKNKIQQGSAWWFNDHFDGMNAQIRSFASTSALANFVGMLTDSRSFLSYTRHDYFRRILCEYIGGLVERGEYPDEEKYLEEIVKGISYNNAVEYFNFDLKLI